MKILHYIPSIDESSGGVGAYMQLLTRDLGKRLELHVVTHPTKEERKLENCTLHYLPYKWLPWDNCKKEFISLLKEVLPDVFHTNSCMQPLSAMTAMWAVELRGERLEFRRMKVIYTPHGMLEPWALRHHWWKKLPAIWLFQRKGVAVCDMIHATAESEKQNLIALGWNKNVTTIANCVQIDEIPFKYGEVRDERLKVRGERGELIGRNILYLGRVHVKKGINFLIEAVAQLKEELQGYTVTIAGPGDDAYIKELKQLAANMGVDEMVQFVGPVYASNKWPLYRNADLFVLPTWSENFGIVVAEALASGTPVITTVGTPWSELEGRSNDNASTSSAQAHNNTSIGTGTDRPDGTPSSNLSPLTSGQCGWWTEIGTEPTVEALRKFLACSDEDLEQMGRNGRKLVEDKYSSDAIADQFVKMYENVVRG